MVFNKTDVIFLDMKVEDAFKYVISCGVIMSPFHQTQLNPVIEESSEPEEGVLIEDLI